MIHRRPAQIRDILEICNMWLERKTKGNMLEAEKWARINLNSGPAWTILAEDVILLVGGIAVQGDMGQVWSVITPKFKEHLKDAYRVLRDTFEEELRVTGIKQVISISDFPEAETLARHLKLEDTGRLFNGEKIYSRLTAWD